MKYIITESHFKHYVSVITEQEDDDDELEVDVVLSFESVVRPSLILKLRFLNNR